MRWLDGIINSMDEFEQTQGDSEGQGSLVRCSLWSHRVRQDLMTEQQLHTHTHIYTHIYVK